MTTSMNRHDEHDGAVIDLAMAKDILSTLSKPRKTLNARWLYDEIGSALFERITVLPEYYPTRAETAILKTHANEISSQWSPGSVLVEFGSGSSLKTEILLSTARDLRAYVAIDVSRDALREATERLEQRFPHLEILPIVRDFSEPFEVPECIVSAPRVGFFPGSTIGNLRPAEARSLLRSFGRSLGAGATLIVGFDPRKSMSLLIPAYNDSEGVTARFNLNLLTRINRELGGDFDVGQFRHESIWNDGESRIEMHLVSEMDQSVLILDRVFHFARGETIHTENSYKYTTRDFERIATEAGYTMGSGWTDGKDLFRVQCLTYRGE
jgi:L-histidine N-alpha-methyltransferase